MLNVYLKTFGPMAVISSFALGMAGSAQGAGSHSLEYTFDFGMQGWGVQGSQPEDATLTKATAQWLTGAGSGSPGPGALRVKVPFSAANQSVQVGVNLNLKTGTNLTGRTLSANVRLVSGLSSDPAHPGGVRLFVQDGAWNWADSGWANLVASESGGWTHLTFSPGTVSLSTIKRLGIQISTSGAGGAPAVVDIDTVSVR